MTSNPMHSAPSLSALSALSANEQFASIARPNPVETEYTISQIEGEIPKELAGTLYRNSPCQKVLPATGSEALHFFDGDALIQAITLENGEARVRSRYARTESFLREQEENAYCHGGLNLPADQKLDKDYPHHQPNTNIVSHAGRLFALAENMPPFEMNPTNLDSMGLWDYDGKLLGLSTTAHPKIDAVTGQMWIHGYQPIAPMLSLYCVEADGRVSLAEAHESPWPTMMHDFAITENFVIFPLGSIHFDLGPLLAGERFSRVLSGLPDRPMQFGIRSRAPGSQVQWIEAPSQGYMFHPGNAYEEDGKILMDACVYESPQGLIDGLDTARAGYGLAGVIARPYLFEIDLAQGTCVERKFSESAAEFPRLDDRLIGRKNRFGYAVTAEPGKDAHGVFRRLTKYDRESGSSVHRSQVEGQWSGEPVFVPRTSTAAEDDGFIVNLMHDANRDATALEIHDARNLLQTPLARLWLDERVALGFHGNWQSAS